MEGIDGRRQPNTVIVNPYSLSITLERCRPGGPDPMNEEYSVTVKIFLDGNQWGALLGENITVGVAGFGDSANEAMAELVRQMDQYHRNWVEFADTD